MLRRIGIVAWWCGALGIVAAVILIIAAVVNGQQDFRELLVVGAVVIGCVTIPAWIISYVVAGSFWRPPKAND